MFKINPKGRAYSNHNTIITWTEFMENPDIEGLLLSTIKRDGLFIVLDDKWEEELVVLAPCEIKYYMGIEDEEARPSFNF